MKTSDMERKFPFQIYLDINYRYIIDSEKNYFEKINFLKKIFQQPFNSKNLVLKIS